MSAVRCGIGESAAYFYADANMKKEHMKVCHISMEKKQKMVYGSIDSLFYGGILCKIRHKKTRV